MIMFINLSVDHPTMTKIVNIDLYLSFVKT
jgi:hypothetical protein